MGVVYIVIDEYVNNDCGLSIREVAGVFLDKQKADNFAVLRNKKTGLPHWEFASCILSESYVEPHKIK